MIHGGGGDDTLDGGSGRNAVSYANIEPIMARNEDSEAVLFVDFFVDLSAGTSIANYTSGYLEVVDGVTRSVNTNTDSLSNFSDVYGSRGNDTLKGDYTSNLLSGDLGDDSLIGGSGDDYILTGQGDDTVIGEADDDTIVIGSGTKTLSGGSGRDTLDLGFQSGEITFDFTTKSYTGTLNEGVAEWLNPGADERQFSSDEGDLTPEEVKRADPLYALSNADSSRRVPNKGSKMASEFATRDVDQAFEATGTYDGVEVVLGGNAAVLIKFSAGFDHFDGTRGSQDTLDLSDKTDSFSFDFATGVSALVELSDDVIIGIDRVLAGSGNDNIMGDALANYIEGNAGGDWLTPGAGDDEVDGGSGSDMVSFFNMEQGITAKLGEGQVTSGDDVNTLRNIENLTGSIHGDFIEGDSGANRLRGLGNYDWFVGSDGNDRIEGATGRDMISYVNATSGVIVDLGAQRGLGGQALGDTYDGVGRVTGSVHIDTFYGSTGEDDFRGLGGYDTFFSSTGGRERYDGGNGADTVVYTNATARISASLLNGYGSDGDAARDLYTSIENLGGSAFNDLIGGDAGRNSLRGLGGDDQMFGYSGADLLYGGRGNDFLDGGSGYDRVIYDHDMDQYDIRSSGDRIIVSWEGSGGGEGVDTLSNIEVLRFADGEFLF